MRAVSLKEYGKVELVELPLPAITDSQVLVKVAYASICGTDQHIFKGEFHPRTKLPLIMGHEFCGSVMETGTNVKTVKPGNRVVVDPLIWCGKCPACKIGHYPACSRLKLLGVDLNGGFAEYVSIDENMLHKLDDTISDKDAALIELLSIGFHACKRASVKKDDTVAVWGCGKVGHAILQAARTITANTIYFIDILAKRLSLAERNFDNIIPVNVKEQNPVEVIHDLTKGNGVDIAFEAVGHAKHIANYPHPVHGCIKIIRGAGTVCVLGLSNEPAPLLMKDLIWKEAKIVASRVNHGEFGDVIKHLSEDNLKPGILISDEIKPKQVMKAFQHLENEPENYLKILLKVSD